MGNVSSDTCRADRRSTFAPMEGFPTPSLPALLKLTDSWSLACSPCYTSKTYFSFPNCSGIQPLHPTAFASQQTHRFLPEPPLGHAIWALSSWGLHCMSTREGIMSRPITAGVCPFPAPYSSDPQHSPLAVLCLWLASDSSCRRVHTGPGFPSQTVLDNRVSGKQHPPKLGFGLGMQTLVGWH